MKVHWFLPTGGDSREVLPTQPGSHRRGPDHSYLAQLAQACDHLGYDAMLTPCGTGCEDAWISTAALLPLTRRIKFLVAFRPALLTPTLAAQMASTYQRMANGRLLVNIVTGAEDAELARFGVHDPKETRYAQTAEFIQVMRGAWSGEPFDFDGEFFHVTGATTRAVPDPAPEIYFGGASDAAETVAAENVDVYLAWGEPPAMVAGRVDRMRTLAAAVVCKPYPLNGKEVQFLRKFLHLTAEKLSRLLKIGKTTISKWENGHDPVGPQSDRLLRLVVAAKGQGLKGIMDHVVDSMIRIEDVEMPFHLEMNPASHSFHYASRGTQPNALANR